MKRVGLWHMENFGALYIHLRYGLVSPALWHRVGVAAFHAELGTERTAHPYSGWISTN